MPKTGALLGEITRTNAEGEILTHSRITTMRTRTLIEEDQEYEILPIDELMLEVLLDIRGLLANPPREIYGEETKP